MIYGVACAGGGSLSQRSCQDGNYRALLSLGAVSVRSVEEETKYWIADEFGKEKEKKRKKRWPGFDIWDEHLYSKYF